MDIYLLPGLGADARLFQFLDLHDHNAISIVWTTPAPDESIEDYALKIAKQIKGDNVALIGVSFGGVMAVEIAKIIQVQKVILISSAASFREIPGVYRIAGKLKLNKLVPGRLLKRSHRLMNWIMGATDPLRKGILADMLRDTDESFLFWAVDKIVNWTNVIVPENVYRIHGNRDWVLPLRSADFLVDGGQHIMILNRAGEVTAAVKKILIERNRSSNRY